MGARYYSSKLGRFSQEDTYRGDGLNLYAYCQNNPVMYYDPGGYMGLCPDPGKPNKGPEGTYSRYVPEGWKKTYETKPLKETAKENDWTLGQQTKNLSNERKVPILDANGNKVGEAHLGHKVKVNGKTMVTRDHFYLNSETANIHHVLPDK